MSENDIVDGVVLNSTEQSGLGAALPVGLLKNVRLIFL
jgi:hypothetical protein